MSTRHPSPCVVRASDTCVWLADGTRVTIKRSVGACGRAWLEVEPQAMVRMEDVLSVDPAGDTLVKKYAAAHAAGTKMAEDWAAHQDVCRHGIPAGQCTECDGGSSPEMTSDPYCIHGHLTTTEQCRKCAKLLARSEAWHSDVQKVIRRMRENEDKACSCSHCEVERAREQPQRFWRVSSMGERSWYWHPVDSDGEMAGLHGKDGESFASPFRATRAEAEADGRASGLPEWKGKP